MPVNFSAWVIMPPAMPEKRRSRDCNNEQRRIGNFYGPVTIINGSKNPPAGNEGTLTNSPYVGHADQAKVFAS